MGSGFLLLIAAPSLWATIGEAPMHVLRIDDHRYELFRVSPVYPWSRGTKELVDSGVWTQAVDQPFVFYDGLRLVRWDLPALELRKHQLVGTWITVEGGIAHLFELEDTDTFRLVSLKGAETATGTVMLSGRTMQLEDGRRFELDWDWTFELDGRRFERMASAMIDDRRPSETMLWDHESRRALDMEPRRHSQPRLRTPKRMTEPKMHAPH